MEGTTGWVEVTQGRKKPGAGETDQLPGFILPLWVLGSSRRENTQWEKCKAEAQATF